MLVNSNIVVVGSCMVDFTSYVPRLPKEGETIHGSKFNVTFGGKGANQCVAAAKLGGKTALIARVGDDTWGENYLKNLYDLNVDAGFVRVTPNQSSGIAQINVSESGANQIIVVAAANKQLSPQDVESAKDLVSNADVVVCQLETSSEVAIRALELCKGISILNGAPAIPNCDKKLLTLPTIFCVNESEAALFAGCPIESTSDAAKAICILLEQGCKTVILTLGSQGTLLASQKSPQPKHILSRPVNCVDSTGAGDAFIGALAYLLANRRDLSLEECVEAANYVAADSVTRPGTQVSFPGPEILNEHFKIKIAAM